MKMHALLIAALICSLILNPFQPAGAADDPIAAAGAFQFNEGTIAPPFSLEDLIGNRVDLAAFQGKIVLINFWTTW